MNTKTRSHHRFRSLAAFSLGELLLAVLCLGMLLLPLLAYVSGIGVLGNRVALESGLSSWQGVQSAAVTEGVDSSSASLLSHAQNSGASLRARAAVSSEAGVPVAGRISVGLLHLAGDGKRPGSSGFQLGPGTRLPEPEVPVQPLVPRTMAPPQLNPASGSSVSVATLAATGRLMVQARSLEGGRVVLRLDLSLPKQDGLGAAVGEVPASLLAAGLSGEAWVEFAGELVPGAVRVPLADGRAEWRVPESGGERLISPSERVSVAYFLDLGSPILRLGSGEYLSGSEVPVDYLLVSGLQGGRGRFEVDWPAWVRGLLGAAVPFSVQGFVTEFQGLSGPAGGDLSGFATEAGLAAWAESSLVAAVPLLGGACRGTCGRWTLQRQLLQLPQPELAVSIPGPLAGGLVAFRAAEVGDLGRLGRLTARSGSVVSAGANLDLELVP